MPRQTRPYRETLLENLRDPAEAAAHLNVALEGLSEPDGWPLFLMALSDVIRAQGVTTVAKNAALGRESLYKSLSPTGNPKLKSVLAILQVMGLRLSVEAPPKKKPRRAIAKAS